MSFAHPFYTPAILALAGGMPRCSCTEGVYW